MSQNPGAQTPGFFLRYGKRVEGRRIVTQTTLTKADRIQGKRIRHE
jgi:hypothetical protein